MNSTHPVNSFRYCPRCAREGFRWQKDSSFVCDSCGFVFYYNAAAAVAALITDEDGRLLLVERGRNPFKGTLDLPGGFVDPHESAEDAVVREVREELSLEVCESRPFLSVPNEYDYGGLTYYTLDLAFFCKVRDFSSLRAGDDAAAYVFCKTSEIDTDSIGLSSIRKIVGNYIEWDKTQPVR